MTASSVPEVNLVAAAKQGDREAFAELFMRYYPSLLAYCKTISGNHHCAEDAVQETALVAWRNFQSFFPEAEFEVWLRAIARRRALQFRRTDLSKLRHLENALEAAYVSESSELRQDRRSALQHCLERLTGRAAEMVRWYYFDGQAVTQIAARSSTNPNSVKTVLFRARSTLLECLHRTLGGKAVP